ncbi:MAG: ATP-grasp domain-containing protein [Marinoscillum sp.]
MEKTSILLIGYDEHLCLSIVYCLRKANYDIHLLTHNKKTVCRYSRFIKKVFFYNDYKDIPEAIAEVSRTQHIDLIMPYDELESLIVSEHKDWLSEFAPVVPLTDPKLFQTAINKNNLDAFLASEKIEVMPKSVLLNAGSTLKDFNGLKFPLLIKPSRSSFGRGIVTIKDEETLKGYLSAKGKNLDGFAAQEFIVGSDISCNVFAVDGEIRHYTIQESPVKQLDNYAKNDDLVFHDDPEVIETISTVTKALNWNGVACLDLRRDAQTGKIYLLEINGRFWGSVSSSYDRANVNFPLIMIKHTLLKEELQYSKQEGIQISMSRFINELKSLKINQLGLTKYRSYLYDPFARFLKYMPR